MPTERSMKQLLMYQTQTRPTETTPTLSTGQDWPSPVLAFSSISMAKRIHQQGRSLATPFPEANSTLESTRLARALSEALASSGVEMIMIALKISSKVTGVLATS